MASNGVNGLRMVASKGGVEWRRVTANGDDRWLRVASGGVFSAKIVCLFVFLLV